MARERRAFPLRHALVCLLLVACSIVAFSIYRFHIQIDYRSLHRRDHDRLWTLPSFVGSRAPKSGVGLVTSDGMWANYNEAMDDVKIVTFADKHYVSLAKVWYQRLSDLGYTEHYIVCIDEKSYDKLKGGGHRVIKKLIVDPDYKRPVLGFARQLLSLRLQFTLELLQNGTSVLVTDCDNIFNRYVPLNGFLNEPYDVFHAHEMRYPVNLYNKHGFVVCAGHQFIRPTPASIQYLTAVLGNCFEKKDCDDQVQYNTALLEMMDTHWNASPSRDGALRIASKVPENDGLLVESFRGHSNATGLRVKVWDRDFAWRLAGDIPDKCPSQHNWVAMPAKVDDLVQTKGMSKVGRKIEIFRIWDLLCRGIAVGN